jgi:apolipoprotein N-acyltransferase
VKKVKLGCLICFEDIFPDISRHFVEKGANVLVNITNDAWFGFTGAPYQHAESSVFRAVENRTNVVRAANTGLSCFIDQKGLVTAKVSSGKNDIFVEGYKSHEMVLTWTRTFYNRYGDIFAYVLILSLLTRVFGYVILRPEKKGVK